MKVALAVELKVTRDEVRDLAQFLSGYIGDQVKRQGMEYRPGSEEEIDRLNEVWAVLTELGQ